MLDLSLVDTGNRDRKEKWITSGSAEYTGGQTLVLQQSSEEESGQSLETERGGGGGAHNINITLPYSAKFPCVEQLAGGHFIPGLQQREYCFSFITV